MADNWLDRYAKGGDILSKQNRARVDTVKAAGSRLRADVARGIRPTVDQVKERAAGLRDKAVTEARRQQINADKARGAVNRTVGGLRETASSAATEVRDRLSSDYKDLERNARATSRRARSAVRVNQILRETAPIDEPAPKPAAPTQEDAMAKSKANQGLRGRLRGILPEKRTGETVKEAAKAVNRGGLFDRTLRGVARIPLRAATSVAGMAARNPITTGLAAGAVLAPALLDEYRTQEKNNWMPDPNYRGPNADRMRPAEPSAPAATPAAPKTLRDTEPSFATGNNSFGTADSFFRTASEVGAPVGLDREGNEIFPNDVAGVDANGAEIIRDRGAPNSFSGVGLRAEPADLRERVNSINQRTAALRDERRAREHGFDNVEDYKQFRMEQQVAGLRAAGLGDNALYALVAQGGLDGVAAEGAGDLKTQIQLADLQRKYAKDADTMDYRNRSLMQTGAIADRNADLTQQGLTLRGDEFDARIDQNRFENEVQLERLRRDAVERIDALDANSKKQVTDVIGLISNPDTREAGLGLAQAILSEDTVGAEALSNWMIAQDAGTGWLDRPLNLFRQAPRPANDQDLRANYRLEGDELMRNGNSFVALDYPPDIRRLLKERLSVKVGQ